MYSTVGGTKLVTTYYSEVNRSGSALAHFMRGLTVPPACGNCLDDFCQVGVDLCHPECGRNNPEGAFDAGNIYSSY